MLRISKKTINEVAAAQARHLAKKPEKRAAEAAAAAQTLQLDNILFKLQLDM